MHFKVKLTLDYLLFQIFNNTIPLNPEYRKTTKTVFHWFSFLDDPMLQNTVRKGDI